jgi:phosphoribosylformylglycinamidine cyclo-ligase
VGLLRRVVQGARRRAGAGQQHRRRGHQAGGALRARPHDTVGQDIVNHCVNDILVQGARPLFFLDYIGMGKIDQRVMAQLHRGPVQGLPPERLRAAGRGDGRAAGPLSDGAYDLVGTIVGAVAKKDLITGRDIRAATC